MSTIAISPTAGPAVGPVIAASRSRAGRRSQVRLTRRGRIVVIGFGLLLAFVLGVVLAGGSIATSDKGAPEVEVVTVRPGDTLWEIAGDAATAVGSGDVGSMMERIRDLNALDSSVVYAGQDLRVPTD